MSQDLFNNKSNDYVQPDLPTCPGQSDNYAFEFLPNKQVGVISGSNIVMSLDFSDFSQPVTGWVQQKKLLEPGEVIFIQGLTKGISNKTETFYSTTAINASVAGYYMSADISIGVYKNFKYTKYDVIGQANYDTGINIVNAINISLENKGISVSVSYDDASTFILSGGLGYDFNDTAITLSLDASTTKYNLVANDTLTIPAFKYPNTGMLGYMLKINYPLSINDESQKYININHPPDNLTFYEASTGNINSYVKYIKAVDVGMNGSSTITTMSAGDYLNYIDTNTKWEKVGPFRSWLSTSDPDSSNIENLITGFYLYNPQSFAVQVEYMVIL